MGKREIDRCITQFKEVFLSIREGEFAPFYVVMGNEPFYADLLIKEVEERALAPHEKDFNLTVIYGNETTSATIVQACSRYPMMAPRQVIIVKEAQHLDLSKYFEAYFSSPMQSTLLMLALNGKMLDKRTSLYKSALKNGVVLETHPLNQEMVPSWIERFLRGKGIKIAPDAAHLMAEYCGTEMRKLALELEKLIALLPSGSNIIDVATVEENTSMSREFSVFELTKALSFRDSAKALKIVRHIGASPKQYPLILTFAALFSHFSRILKYHGALMQKPPLPKSKIAPLLGVNPFFISEYEYAAKNYPLLKCMAAISYIRKYDSISKSGDRGESKDGELLLELIIKILN